MTHLYHQGLEEAADSFTGYHRKNESIVYGVGWLVIIVIILLDMIRTQSAEDKPVFDSGLIVHLAFGIIPFIVLFAVNNYYLIPRLLLKNRLSRYIFGITLLILLIWGMQLAVGTAMRPASPPPHNFPHHTRPLFTLPFFLDFIYDLLVVGINIVIALLFQQYGNRLEHENRMKIEAEHRLSYLKAQINPHFYMNMLNNLHAMIDIDMERAQEMVINLSHLMRYILYDSERERVELSKEVDFLINYIELMRLRYPEGRVRISTSFPSNEAMSGITIPPLIFLSLIENSFKHGISYRERSFINIEIQTSPDRLLFRAANSLHSSTDKWSREEKDNNSNKERADNNDRGVGLENTRQRLRLIYGEKARLTIKTEEDTFEVRIRIDL